MNSVQPISTAPGTDGARLPCRPHASGYGEAYGSLPGEPSIQQEAATPGDQQPEPYQADRAFRAMLAQLTGGISPIALSLAYMDWASRLTAAPQRQLEISQDALRGTKQFLDAALHCFSPQHGPWSLIKPKPQDRRFAGSEWERPPFNLLAQAFLLNEQWCHEATTGVRGVAPRNEAIVEFSVRQVLDMLAPSNFAVTNPEVLDKVFRSRGENFVFGWQNWLSDWMQLLSRRQAGLGQGFRRWRSCRDVTRQGRVP
jgi:polyhydroxyalkanoate synthase subunit PhaC